VDYDTRDGERESADNEEIAEQRREQASQPVVSCGNVPVLFHEKGDFYGLLGHWR
jgi:hypothetical protein